MKNLAYILSILVLTFQVTAGEKSLLEHSVSTLEGKASSLGEHKGKVLLVVNVASRCGYTPQYKDLEGLYQKFKDQGLVVCGFPCNQFGSQEPGSASEIREFCSTRFNVTFPMYEKVDVKGSNQHPIYASLSGKASPFPGDVRWNFGKFLIGRDGTVIKRFGSSTGPMSDEMLKAVETALN